MTFFFPSMPPTLSVKSDKNEDITLLEIQDHKQSKAVFRYSYIQSVLGFLFTIIWKYYEWKAKIVFVHLFYYSLLCEWSFRLLRQFAWSCSFASSLVCALSQLMVWSIVYIQTHRWKWHHLFYLAGVLYCDNRSNSVDLQQSRRLYSVIFKGGIFPFWLLFAVSLPHCTFLAFRDL